MKIKYFIPMMIGVNVFGIGTLVGLYLNRVDIIQHSMFVCIVGSLIAFSCVVYDMIKNPVVR